MRARVSQRAERRGQGHGWPGSVADLCCQGSAIADYQVAEEHARGPGQVYSVDADQ